MNYYIIPGLKYTEPRTVSPDTIIKSVSKYLSISEIKMKGKDRDREYVIARQIAIWMLRKYTLLSLKNIGLLFNRDHTTVIHSVNTVDNFIQIKDNHFLKIVNDIQQDFLQTVKKFDS